MPCCPTGLCCCSMAAMNLAAFRAAVDAYRRPTGRTQQELARAVGIHPKRLSHKLHGTDRSVLTHEDVRSIVRVLAAWQALQTQAQAVDLLGLMDLGYSSFSPAEWTSPPFAQLDSYPGPEQPQTPRATIRPARAMATHGSLPAELTPLIGRTDQVEQLLELLGGPMRLVTLTGPGGVGKTRLALAAAAVAARTDTPVHLVPLAAISDPALVPGEIAAELGMHEAAGSRGELETRLLEYLRDRQVLLVLDNLEQVLGSATLVADLLGAAPRARVLATSRVPLRIYGEHEFRVPPLRLPAPDAPPDEVLASEAVTLFTQRARAARADLRSEPRDASLFAAICARLDGLPLAIELAAARARHLPPPLLLDRLTNRLAVLDRGPTNAPARQRTLRATLDWSYELLPSALQRVFERLGVFVGGCTLEAAQAVCANDAEDIEDAMWELVDAALVEVSIDDNDAASTPRFYMLETVHEYALARLSNSGDEEVVRNRHAAWYVGWAERARRELTGPDQAAWYRRIDAELANCRAARAWYQADPNGAETEVALAAALAHYFHIRAPGREAHDWLCAALARGSDMASPARAAILTWLGQSEYLAGGTQSARERLVESVAIARQSGDRTLLALTLRHLALYGGDPEAEPPLLEEAAAAAREADDGHERALALSYLGAIREYQGDIATAQRLYEEAIAAARASQAPAATADVLLRLGRLALERGDHADAAAAMEEALALCRSIGYHAFVAFASRQLARVALARGDLCEARTRVAASLDIARQAEPGTESLGPLRTAATVAVGVGNPKLAVRLLASESAWRTQHPLGTDSSLWARWVLAGQGVEEDLYRARAVIGDFEFEAAWAEGSALTIKAALVEALELKSQPALSR